MAEEPSSPKIASLRFEEFQVHKVHLERFPEAEQSHLKYRVDFRPKGHINWEEGWFLLTIEISIACTPKTFESDLEVRSTFSFNRQEKIDLLNKLFTNNTLALTFPYIRAYISALTALSGLATITMPTFNLTGYSKVLKENITEEGTATIEE